MAIGTEGQAEIQNLNPYQETGNLIVKLKTTAPSEKLTKLIDWYPSPSDQAKLEKGNNDTKATFTARALGHLAQWIDETQNLGIYRPQDYQTAAGSLGLSHGQSVRLGELIGQITFGLGKYSDYLIDNLLGGRISLVAAKLQTTGEAIGLHRRIYDRDPNGQLEKLQIILGDGKVITNSVEAILQLESLPRRMALESASFDERENKFEIKLSASK